jgi:transposase
VDLQQLYALAQEFVTMITRQQAEALEGWLQRAEHTDFPALARFAKGLRQDYAAVSADLTLAWSNGQTEGQVHRLKLIKRLAYGRANFDLLRLRVLHGWGQKKQQKPQTSGGTSPNLPSPQSHDTQEADEYPVVLPC